ncbi:hypothetical protein CBL_00695 [Carabus blaptoides fortunei]
MSIYKSTSYPLFPRCLLQFEIFFKIVLERALNCTDAQKCKIGSGNVRGKCRCVCLKWRVKIEDETTSQSASEERIGCSGLQRIRRYEQEFSDRFSTSQATARGDRRAFGNLQR